MARMAIDDSVQRDPRITKLSMLVGWSRRETLGCLVQDVWPICYDQRTAVVSIEMVDIAAGVPGFAMHMVTAELARVVRGNSKIAIKGAQERIEYLDHKRAAGRVGGLKSGESRRQIASTASSIGSSDAQARGNPPVPDPPPSPVPDLVPDPVPDQEEEIAANAARVPVSGGGNQTRKRKPTLSEPSESELASIRAVLAKLGERNGIAYSCSDKHKALILGRLREGYTEMDLRKIIAYCDAQWRDKENMRAYLRPETLFGPETIQRYADAARSQYERENAQGASP